MEYVGKIKKKNILKSKYFDILIFFCNFVR